MSGLWQRVRPTSVITALLWLTVVELVALAVVASVAYQSHGQMGVIAAVLAAAVCWMSGSLALCLVGVFRGPQAVHGVLAAMFSVAASLFRAVGGYLSDKYGARAVMYWAFIFCTICCFLLSYPETDYVVHGINGDVSFSFGWGAKEAAMR